MDQYRIETESDQNYEVEEKYAPYKKIKREIDLSIQASNYERAILFTKKLLFFLPEDAELYFLLGELYLKSYDLSSAITCLNKASLLKGDDPKMKLKLNNLLFCKGLINLQVSNQLENDMDFLGKMHLNMTKSAYYYLKAKSFLVLNNIPQCIENLNKILSSDKDDEHALILLGKVFMNTGRVREGENLLWKAYEINPDNEETIQFVKIMKNKMDEILKEANLNVLKGRLKLGLLLATKALKVYPNHPEALLLRSSIYKSLGMLNESIQDLTKAKKNCSENYLDDSMNHYIRSCLSNIYNELSQAKIKTRNFSEAMYYAEEAIKNNQNDIQAHLNKGDCFLYQHDIASAKEEYLTSIKLDKNNVTASCRLAGVLYKFAILSYNSKDYKEALDYLNKAIYYSDKFDNIYVLRARTHLKLGNIKGAFEDASLAYLINPKNQDAIEIKKYLS